MNGIRPSLVDVRQILGPTQVFACISAILALKAVLFFVSYLRARRQFPGPPISSIWSGNLSETMTDDVHEKWRAWHRTYGPVFQTWNGLFSRVVYIGDPTLISKIANSNWPKFPAQYSGFKPLSGSALFAQMDQERWKQQRKGLAPAFQPATVSNQYSALHKYLTKFVEEIDKAAERGTSVDLSTLHVLLTLDFVGDVAFGTELNAIRDGADCRILQIFHDVLPELMKCGLFPLRAKVPILDSTRRMHRGIRELRAMAHNSVEDARSADNKADIASGSKRIFEILAQQCRADGTYLFSAEELVDNYVTFLVAGGDPTAHTMTFAVNEILKKPKVLAKLRAELDEVLPPDCEIPTIEQVSSLRYLHLIIKETLRHNGPGFGTFRYTPKDTEINGVTLPANTTLALWNPQVHRDPQLWGADVDEFVPERWETGKAPLPGSYFPFSYGPRKCLGEGLAMLEMSLTLATLFKRYDLEFQAGFSMEYLPSFTLCSKNGLPVKSQQRK
ncbi:cytochrome P450 46A1 [Fomitiporia mediterranea MF3/22]|uniref:cytochrome P450 46A1 n=1 Tax=Fomitiporia mediterranea (strain MF3/22) TaxID=694068 RepID=UPI0004408638|nr:cytochrome P450 46A1 [Fomitiporia mediterranea MF3/22]EJD00090.1 cytochrome P450 46A1 [Fomitiporia mediterranea MF3/22]